MKYHAFRSFISNLSLPLRMLLLVGISGFVVLFMPAAVDWEIRVLCLWDVAILSFLVQVAGLLLPVSPERTISYSRLRSMNSALLFSLVIFTACFSIVVIGLMLTDSKDTPQPFRSIQIWLSLVAILCSWLLTHLMFALHYAHVYYQASDPLDPTKYGGGLEFPNEAHPDYLDFMYFAFTISMASQTSDVVITARPLRRLVLLHAIVSFFFYSVILATTVNTVASLV